MAEQPSRPTRVSRPPARLRESNNSTVLQVFGGRSQGRQQQPTRNSSRKRAADSLASHVISLADSDFQADDEDYQQGSGSDSCYSDEEELACKGTAKPRRSKLKVVRVVKTKSGPAAVAKGQGVAR